MLAHYLQKRDDILNTQKYPEIPRKTWKYPRVKVKDTWKYLIVNFIAPTRIATRYFYQYPSRLDIENPYPLGTDASSRRLYANLKQFYSKSKHFVRCFGANFFEAKSALVLKFTPFPCLALV